MKKLLLLLVIFATCSTFFVFSKLSSYEETITGAPPYDPDGGYVSEDEDFSWVKNWKRPEGPTKVALQVGHWKNEEVPEELHRLRGNTGATGGGKMEWEVNYEIAVETKKILEEVGLTVELLPATIPPRYYADVFVAIHADGHTDPTKTGFKAAAPRRDYTGKANDLVSFIRQEYEKSTGMVWDEETITRNMKGYYAFSWWRFEHAVHPMTPSAILETGFLTSPRDQELIISNPELAAEGLANGVITFLTSTGMM